MVRRDEGRDEECMEGCGWKGSRFYDCKSAKGRNTKEVIPTDVYWFFAVMLFPKVYHLFSPGTRQLVPSMRWDYAQASYKVNRIRLHFFL